MEGKREREVYQSLVLYWSSSGQTKKPFPPGIGAGAEATMVHRKVRVAMIGSVRRILGGYSWV